MTTGGEEQGSVGDGEEGERWIEEKENQTEWRKWAGGGGARAFAIYHSAEGRHFFQSLRFVLRVLLSVKDITGRLQLRSLPGFIYVCLILGVALRDGGGNALLAIHPTSFIDSEQKGHWGKAFPLFLVNGV